MQSMFRPLCFGSPGQGCCPLPPQLLAGRSVGPIEAMGPFRAAAGAEAAQKKRRLNRRDTDEQVREACARQLPG
eukprot:682749-Heterocapsa_arctica.AAC.1